MKGYISRICTLLFFCIAVFSCQPSEQINAQQILDNAITVAGGELFLKTTIDFDFRDRHYRSIRYGGTYQYERIFLDIDSNLVKDVLNNDGFERYVNDSFSTLTPDTMKVKYARSVNSVLYFALLPYGLNDEAVNKNYLGKSELKGEFYHKIQVTFNQDGGGEDHEDVFVYWIHQSDYTVDYFSYSYLVDGGGKRFRSAYNPRTVNGIRFVDYVNYSNENEEYSIVDFDKAYLEGDLKELSRIEIDNIKVEIAN